MNSSGIKRGLATTAITALAVTGLPFLASSAQAATVVLPGDNAIDLISQADPAGADTGMSTKFDGVDNVVQLAAAGGKNVISVQFQYRDVSVGAAWNNIGSPVSRSNGIFAATWNPAAVLGQTDIEVQAVALDLNNAPIASSGTATGGSTVGATNVESVNITNAPGSDLGLFKQPYTTEGASAMLAGVSGTTSAPAGAGSTVALDARVGGTATGTSAPPTAATVPAGSAPFSNWVGNLSFAPDYAFTAGGGDQLVIGATSRDGGQDDSDDVVAVAPYAAVIDSITATAKQASVPVGGKSDITVKVVDTKGNPVVGAQVVRTGADETTAEYTNARGEITYAAQSAGTYSYFVNTTDTNGYDSAVDKKSADVVISEFVPGLAKITATSVDGMAFDRDEYAAGDVKIQTKDQTGAPRAGADVYYKWNIDPFAPGAANIVGTEQGPVQTALVDGGTDNARAEATVPVPAGPSGTYTLLTYTKSLGGVGGYTEAPIDFKIGEAAVDFDQPNPAQAKIGESITLTGQLELEDGTAIGSIDRADGDPLGDVNRRLTLDYTVGVENGGAGDSKLAPSASQAGAQALYTIAADGLSGTVQVGADGKIAVKINDASPETLKEIGALLRTGGGRATGATTDGSFDDGASSNKVDFLVSLDPAKIEAGSWNPLFGAATPGRPVNIPVTVRNADNDILTGVPVKIDVANGGFVTPSATSAAALQATEAGGAYGRWVNSGTSVTTPTGDNGAANATIAIERAEGFDDDFSHRVNVTFTAGGVTQALAGGIQFSAENALNLGDVTLAVSEETVPDTAGDIQTREKVFYDVTAKDQFGNLSNEDVATDDADNAKAGFNTGLPGFYVGGPSNPDTGKTVPTVQPNGESSFYAAATDNTVQMLTATVLGKATSASAADTDPVLPGIQVNRVESSSNKQQSDELSWYKIDWDASTYSLKKSTADRVTVGTPVTVTAKATDQKGNGIRYLGVQFVRTGPDEDNGAIENFGTTDENGEETYFFSGSKNGAAQVNVQFTEGTNPTSGDPTGDVVGTAAPVVVQFGPGEPEGPTVVPINAKLTGNNNGARRDVLRVTTAPAAGEAQTLLYRVVKGKRVLVATKRLWSTGKTTFRVRDLNKGNFTKYFVVVRGTKTTKQDRSNTTRVR